MTETAAPRSGTAAHPGGRSRTGAVVRWVGRILPLLALLYAVLVGLGYLLAHPLKGSGLEDAEDNVNESLANGRTPTMNHITFWLSELGNTATIVGLMLLVAIVLRLVLKRWRESVFVVIAVSCQALVFLLTTLVIDRRRPDVKHLDASPPTSSFPSGHVGAATALYVSVALVVLWTARNRVLKVIGVLLLIACPILVAYARLYRGMHHPTDIAGSEVNAWSCIAIAAYATARTRWRSLVNPSGAPDRAPAR
jgi:undecaprenyl-diphosphatase